MRTFDLTTPDGKVFELQVPDNATNEQIQGKVNQFKSQYSPQVAEKKESSWRDTPMKAVGEIKDAAMQAAAYVNPAPTMKAMAQNPSMVMEMAKGLKKIPGQFANSYVHPVESFKERPIGTVLDLTTGVNALSKGAGLTVNKLKPFIKGAGAQIESMSGSKAGSLEAAYKDSGLITAPGKKAVQSLYESAKESTGGGFRQALKEIPEKKAIVEEIYQLAKKGEVTPAEALEGRKALDTIKNQVAKPYYDNVRTTLDKIAKVAFAEGDAAYKKAVFAESLRNIVPQNKYGGASAFKTAIITGLEGLAQAGGIPKAIARTAQLAMSPAAAGVAATGAGMVARKLSPLVNLPISTPATAVASVAEKIPMPTKEEPKPTPKEAKEYLKAVLKDHPEMDLDEARKLARKRWKADKSK